MDQSARIIQDRYSDRYNITMQRPHRPCLRPGCGKLILGGIRGPGGGYCEQHKPPDLSDQWRGSARERGYDTAWGKFREQYLRRHPFCQVCQAAGYNQPAVIPHHIRPLPDGNKYDEGNLMAVCHACHNRIHFGSAGK